MATQKKTFNDVFDKGPKGATGPKDWQQAATKAANPAPSAGNLNDLIGVLASGAPERGRYGLTMGNPYSGLDQVERGRLTDSQVADRQAGMQRDMFPAPMTEPGGDAAALARFQAETNPTTIQNPTTGGRVALRNGQPVGYSGDVGQLQGVFNPGMEPANGAPTGPFLPEEQGRRQQNMQSALDNVIQSQGQQGPPVSAQTPQTATQALASRESARRATEGWDWAEAPENDPMNFQAVTAGSGQPAPQAPLPFPPPAPQAPQAPQAQPLRMGDVPGRPRVGMVPMAGMGLGGIFTGASDAAYNNIAAPLAEKVWGLDIGESNLYDAYTKWLMDQNLLR